MTLALLGMLTAYIAISPTQYHIRRRGSLPHPRPCRDVPPPTLEVNQRSNPPFGRGSEVGALRDTGDIWSHRDWCNLRLTTGDDDTR